MSTAKSSSSNNNVREFDELRHFLACDNPSCRKLNPPKRCARCQSTYYCSVQCQRAHWKMGGHKYKCRCIVEYRAKWEANFVVPVDAKVADDAVCGICLESPIRHPYHLPHCQHVFCFKCISDYQGPQLSFVPRSNDSCPLCRAKIGKHVFDVATAKARIYITRVHYILDDNDVDARNEMYRMAGIEVDKMLEAHPQDLYALNSRAKLLVPTNPLEAIKLYQRTFEVHRIGALERAKVEAMVDRANSARDSGHVELARQLTAALVQYTEQHDQWRQTFGSFGSHCTWVAHLSLAEAYEAAGLYKEASTEYFKIYYTLGTPIEEEADEDNEGMLLTELLCGLSRVSYHLGDYVFAIHTVELLWLARRTFCGVHKLVAMSLLALAYKPGASGTTVPSAIGNLYSATLDCAIELAYKGFAYEDQWDDKNKNLNRKFLQELCDKKAAADEINSVKTSIDGNTGKKQVATETGNNVDPVGQVDESAQAAGSTNQPQRTIRRKKGRKNKKRSGK